MAKREASKATFPRTFISDVHSTLAGNGTDCGRWDHQAAGASCSPPVRPSCSPSSRPDCTPRSVLRTMVETLHVTTVRSLFRNWQAAIGKARQHPRHRHPPPLAFSGRIGSTVDRQARIACRSWVSGELCAMIRSHVRSLYHNCYHVLVFLKKKYR